MWPGAKAQQDGHLLTPRAGGAAEEGRTAPRSQAEAFPSGQGRWLPQSPESGEQGPRGSPVRTGNSQRVLGGRAIQVQGLFWKLENLGGGGDFLI